MGRYAFFNTGYEYKFAFAIQESEDIQRFGGQDVSDPNDPEEGAHSWTTDDAEYISAELRDYEEHFGIKLPKIEDFPKTVEGTWKIRSAMDDLNKTTENWNTYYTALLGLLILHQLQYEPNLHASYET
jgi:hypothetical protein